MTTTLYDEGSTLTIPPTRLELAAADLIAWYVDLVGRDELTLRTTHYCATRDVNDAKIPPSGHLLEMAVILDHYGWRIVFATGQGTDPEGAAGIEWRHDATIVGASEFTALDPIAVHLDGDIRVSDMTGTLTGARYEAGRGRVGELLGEVVWKLMAPGPDDVGP